MARYFIGCTGNTYVVAELRASHPVEALGEIRSTVDDDGWVLLHMAGIGVPVYIRFDAIVAIKPYQDRDRKPWQARDSAGG